MKEDIERNCSQCTGILTSFAPFCVFCLSVRQSLKYLNASFMVLTSSRAERSLGSTDVIWAFLLQALTESTLQPAQDSPAFSEALRSLLRWRKINSNKEMQTWQHFNPLGCLDTQTSLGLYNRSGVCSPVSCITCEHGLEDNAEIALRKESSDTHRKKYLY